MTTSLFIHSFVDGNFSCSHVLAVVNSVDEAILDASI